MTMISTALSAGGAASMASGIGLEAGLGAGTDPALAEAALGSQESFQAGDRSPAVLTEPSLDVAIVGGGVFGLAAALELHRRGKSVGVFDIGPIPHPLAASTDIAKAVRMAYGADQFLTRLAKESRRRWIEWNDRFGEETYRETGTLVVSPDLQQPYIENSRQTLQTEGFKTEDIDASVLRQRFPAWDPQNNLQGIFIEQGGWVDSSQVVRQLAGEARQADILIREGFRTVSLDVNGGRIQGIISNQGERIVAGGVIVAAGAWTPHLLPEIKSFFQTTGQPNVYLKPRDSSLFSSPQFPTFAVVSNKLFYGFPVNPEGILKIGQHVPSGEIHPESPDRLVTLEQVSEFQSLIRSIWPGLQDAFLVGTRICLYCMTQDEMFLIDRHPQIEGLAIATGGSGHAFKFAPLLGDWIADAYEGKKNEDLKAFRWRLDPADREGGT